MKSVNRLLKFCGIFLLLSVTANLRSQTNPNTLEAIPANNFPVTKNKIRFRIDLGEAKAAHQMIGVKLLQLAEIASPSRIRR